MDNEKMEEILSNERQFRIYVMQAFERVEKELEIIKEKLNNIQTDTDEYED